MLPTDLSPKAQQIIDRLSAINYENPNIDEQRIRDAFCRHLEALNLPDYPVEIYRSFDGAFDAVSKADRNRKPQWKVNTDAAWSHALQTVKAAALEAAWKAELKAEWEVVKTAALEAVLKTTPAAASDIVSDDGSYKLWPTVFKAAGYGWWEFEKKITGKDHQDVFWSTWWCRPLKAVLFPASDAARQAALEAASNAVSGAAWDEAWKAAFKTAWDEADDCATNLAFQNAEGTVAWNAVVSAASKVMRTVGWNTVRDTAFGVSHWVPEKEAMQNIESYVEPAAANINFTVSSNRHDEYCAVWMPFIDALEAGTFCFWITQTKVIVLTAPLIRIQDNRLHADGQPAVQWSDREYYYFWRGIQIPQKYGAVLSDNWQPQWLLEEANTPRRCILIQGIGYDRILQDLEAVELDTWREYSLLKIQADIDVEPIHLLKITCPSTKHIKVLRVPPNITSAREAIIWCNWGIDPEQFSVES